MNLSVITPGLPKNKKDVILICMTMSEFTVSVTTDTHPMGTRMYCFDCKRCTYDASQPVKNEYQNPYNHFLSKKCCGGPDQLIEYYEECKAEFESHQMLQARKDNFSDP